MKIILLFVITSFLFCFQSQSCGIRRDDRNIQLKGSRDRNDLVFFYKKDISYDETSFFEDNVLHKPRPDGQGGDLPDGVIDLFLVTNSGFKGFAFNFSKKATPQQRQNLKSTLESSPLVHKVYEDVIPDEITDLK